MGDCDQGLECKHNNKIADAPGTCIELGILTYMIFNKGYFESKYHYLETYMLFCRYLGISNVTTIPPTGMCKSWNGKTCTHDDKVDVGRGAGSCNSNNDCPCCAPFCSKEGYCQTHDLQSGIGTWYNKSTNGYFLSMSYYEVGIWILSHMN